MAQNRVPLRLPKIDNSCNQKNIVSYLCPYLTNVSDIYEGCKANVKVYSERKLLTIVKLATSKYAQNHIEKLLTSKFSKFFFLSKLSHLLYNPHKYHRHWLNRGEDMRQCFFGDMNCTFLVTVEGHGFWPILAWKFRFLIILKLVTTKSSQFFLHFKILYFSYSLYKYDKNWTNRKKVMAL